MNEILPRRELGRGYFVLLFIINYFLKMSPSMFPKYHIKL